MVCPLSLSSLYKCNMFCVQVVIMRTDGMTTLSSLYKCNMFCAQLVIVWTDGMSTLSILIV